MRLLGNRVLLKKPKGGIRKTSGGILLSENGYYDRGLRCKILDCGDSRRLKGCEGKEAIISHLVGLDVEVDGVKCIIVKDLDVQGVIDEC